MDEKWRLSLWAAAAAKDMEFVATQRSSILPRAKCLAGEAQSKKSVVTFLTSKSPAEIYLCRASQTVKKISNRP